MNTNGRVLYVTIVGGILVMSGAMVKAAPISPLFVTKPQPMQFADLSGIEEWRDGGAKVIYIKDDKGQWYQADMREACMKLDTSKGVRFIIESGDGASRYSAVDVANHQCRITTINKIKTPPPR